MDEAPQIVVVGAACRDLVDDDARGWRLGGGASYSALALARLGLRVRALVGGRRPGGLVDRAATSFARPAWTSGSCTGARGPIFINVETPDGRLQRAHEVSDPVPSAALPDGLGRPSGVDVRAGRGRGARRVGRACRRRDALVAVGWQGLLRVLVAGEPVTRHRAGPRRRSSRGPTSSASARTTSTRARRSSASPRTLHPGATLLFTDGARGGTAIETAHDGVVTGALAVGARSRCRALVDPVGAGDTFLAGVLRRAHRPRRSSAAASGPDGGPPVRRGAASLDPASGRAARRAVARGGARAARRGRDRQGSARRCDRLACRRSRAARRAPRRSRSASRRGCGRPVIAGAAPAGATPPASRRGRPPGSPRRCSRSFATSIQAIDPERRPPRPRVCHASADSAHRPSRRSTRARSAASRSSVQRGLERVPGRRTRAPARARPPRPFASSPRQPPRRPLPPKWGRTRGAHQASRSVSAASRAAAGATASARTGRGRGRGRPARRPGTRAPRRGAAPACTPATGRRGRRVAPRGGRPLRVAPLDVGEQQPERAHVLLVVDHDARPARRPARRGARRGRSTGSPSPRRRRSG